MGADSYAARLTVEAKKDGRRRESGMMRSLTRLVQVIAVILVPLGLALFWRQYVHLDRPFQEAVVSTVAALVGMIPEGRICSPAWRWQWALSGWPGGTPDSRAQRDRDAGTGGCALCGQDRHHYRKRDAGGASGASSRGGLPGGEMARLVGMYVLRIGDDNPTAQALGKAFPADTLPREWAEAGRSPFPPNANGAR